MEKTEFVLNFLREFIVGSELEAIDAQLFRVLHKTCHDTDSLVPLQSLAISKELPSSGQELDRFLELVDEFSKYQATFAGSLAKVENLQLDKNSDFSLSKN